MCFDQLIVPNNRMVDYLIGQGAAEDRLINLQMLDRLSEDPVPERPLAPAVCVVGDLSRKRSRYLHEIPRGKLTWHLHGEGWKGKAKRTDMLYHGGKTTQLEGSFGLIWEGQSARVCTGAQGAYMMLSTPRKMSLYLTQGMPVIVWKWSAMAEFVRENGLGLVIDQIADIHGAISALTAEEYAEMASSARAWGEKLRRGDMTRDALRQLRG